MNKVEIGRRAKEFVEDERFTQAVEVMRQGIYERWRVCSVADHETQHELKIMDKVLNDFVRHFRNAIDEGKMEEATMLSKLRKIRKI